MWITPSQARPVLLDRWRPIRRSRVREGAGTADNRRCRVRRPRRNARRGRSFPASPRTHEATPRTRAQERGRPQPTNARDRHVARGKHSATVLAAVASIAFGASSANHYGTKPVAYAPASVTIANFAFSPRALTVTQGTTVTWTDNDPFDHSIVASDKSFTSDKVGNGSPTFQFTFDTPGQFAYSCGIHPSMSGHVTVMA
jgi:plastocyanin